MQQTIGITLILSIFLSTFVVAPDAFAASNGKGRSIQVVSDPYNVGNPTHYTVIRGTSKITFSHPLAGQFGRAEISVREKNGNKITRFILSPDRKTYRVALQMEVPFAKHNSTSEAAICPDPNGPTSIKMVQLLKGKVNDGEEIAKKRDELTKAKFFDSSCFDPSFPEDHRNAILNAAADVLTTSTQDISAAPKYLRCMEKYGFGHESGVIEALVKQSITDTKVNPRVRISCTADKKAKPGQFDDETREVSIKKTFKAVREDYAVKIFHELLHAAPIEDGAPLAAIEDCCTQGEQCEILKALGDQRRQGEKKLTIAEALDSKAGTGASVVTVLEGTDNEAATFGKPNPKLTDFAKSLLNELEPSLQCRMLTKPVCDRDKAGAFKAVNAAAQCVPKPGVDTFGHSNFFMTIAVPASNALVLEAPVCPNNVFDRLPEFKQEIKTKQKTEDRRTAAELLENVPQTSPLEWDSSKAVPLRMANNSNYDASDASAPTEVPKPPARTIASISPLPDEAPQRRLGSTDNRVDVATGRASMLVDTMEKAALRVSQTLTPENLDSRKVDKVAIFSNDYKPTTKNPQYVVASLATGVMKVADFGDMKGLDFPNPFANVKQKVNRDTGLFTTMQVDAKDPKQKQVAKGADTATARASSNASSEDESSAGKSASAGAVSSSSNTTASSSANKTVAENRAPNSNSKHDFKNMDRTTLLNFVTSSYRSVAADLDDRDFKEALGRNDIQILDHEGRRIGSMKPATRFVYRGDLSPPRLVKTRADRNGK